MVTVTRTFELSEEAAAELDRLAHDGNCAPADVLNSLLVPLGDDEVKESDFTPEQWDMIRQGEAEADAGLFASEEEVNALFRRYRSVA